MKRILLIEDDEDIALSLKCTLEKDGSFSVVDVRDGEGGLRAAEDCPPDLVILDLGLPGGEGPDVRRRLRRCAKTASVPIILAASRADAVGGAERLDPSTDDFIPKPFSIQEVLARARAVLRRGDRAAGGGETLEDSPVVVDCGARRVRVAGREVVLTRKEFDLLAHLLRNRGQVLSRESMLERVWGYDRPGETRTVDVHVRRVRQKLGGALGERIETVVGAGYRYRGRL